MGLITVGILKHLSSVVKSFTSSASLVLTSLLSSIIFKVNLKYPLTVNDRFLTRTVAFYLAVLNLSIAIYLYRSYPQQRIVKQVAVSPIEDIS